MRERYQIEVGLTLHPAWFCKAQRCDWSGNPTAHARGFSAGVIGVGSNAASSEAHEGRLPWRAHIESRVVLKAACPET